MSEQIILKKTCEQCKELHQIHVYKKDYEAWKNGKHIQNAMSYVPGDIRELLISDICGSCFDELFDNKNS